MKTRHDRHRRRLRPWVAIMVVAAVTVRMSGAALAAETPPASQAQPAPQPQQGWRVECDSTAKTLDCRLVAEAINPQNHQLLVAVVIRVPSETKKPVMAIQLPLGILVSAPVGLRVEHRAQPQKNAPASLAIQTCTQAGCFVGAPIADDLLAQMRIGARMDITYQTTDQHEVSVPLPLAGFAAAYDKIK